ncbi:MAG: glycosyltransferase [Clostridia bacterium]|nr:glycosyltransferase [Clostridia bacterium]
MQDHQTKLSFVIPCYRSEETIETVIEEIRSTVSQRAGYSYEIICVNDSSPDRVLDVLLRLAADDPRIKVIDLAKNMGKHAAVLAGYAFVTGDYVVNLDDDCQSPVCELWKLLDPVESGAYDVATAKYGKKKQAFWKNLGSWVNMKVGTAMLNKPKNMYFENFSLLKRFVVDEVLRYKNPYPYLEGLVLRATSRILPVEMEERERGDGKATGYTFRKSMALFFNGFTAFSVKPLRVSTIIGSAAAIGGFVWALVAVIRKLIHPESVQILGYTSIIAILLILGGLILLSLGLIGEYIGRIYISLNNSPQYVIRQTVNTSLEDTPDE